MNKLDRDYLELCNEILNTGNDKSDRTGTGTISLFSRELKYKFNDESFPILTTKKMPFKIIVTELLWFLKGKSDLKSLLNENCHIWDGDAYKNYVTKFEKMHYIEQQTIGIYDNPLGYSGCTTYKAYTKDEFINKVKIDEEFSKKWGELGPIYGKQWRNWNGKDQIVELINNLKNNPDSRRLLVSAWNVDEIDKAILPPCHYSFQCYTTNIPPMERYYSFNEYAKNMGLDVTGMSTDDAMIYYNYPSRKLSLKFNMRSTDLSLDYPFNITSYALLLKILCDLVNMIPDELICSMGDVHIYKNQIDGIKEQILREPKILPKLKIKRKITNIDNINIDDFELINYESHPSIKIPLSN